jgi:predicted ribosomally synthesized peptide with SipW-like signal peptide
MVITMKKTEKQQKKHPCGGRPNPPRAGKRAFVLCAALALALVLVFATGGTLAWLTSRDERENAMRVADLKGSVRADGGYTVKNESNQPAVARVMLLPVVAKDGMLLSGEAVGYGLADGWADGLDGYLYYTAVMAAGEETAPFKPGQAPAIAADPAFAFSEADVAVKVKAEFMPAAGWGDATAREYAYRFAWFGADGPPEADPLKTVDAKLAAAVDASY